MLVNNSSFSLGGDERRREAREGCVRNGTLSKPTAKSFKGCADCAVDLEIVVSALQLLTSLQMAV